MIIISLAYLRVKVSVAFRSWAPKKREEMFWAEPKSIVIMSVDCVPSEAQLAEGARVGLSKLLTGNPAAVELAVRVPASLAILQRSFSPATPTRP